MSNLRCELCSLNFDRGDHLPRLLPFCGHTYCSKCIEDRILNTHNGIPTCPIDKVECCSFSPTQGINYFPLNHTLIGLLANPKVKELTNSCPTHHKVLNYICVKELCLVCTECLLSGQHVGHPYKREEQFVGDLDKVVREGKLSEQKMSQQISKLKTSLKIDAFNDSVDVKRKILRREARECFDQIRLQVDTLETRTMDDVDRHLESFVNISNYIQQTLEAMEGQVSGFDNRLTQIALFLSDRNSRSIPPDILVDSALLDRETDQIRLCIKDLESKAKSVSINSLQNIALQTNITAVLGAIEQSVRVVSTDTGIFSKTIAESDLSNSHNQSQNNVNVNVNRELSMSEQKVSRNRSCILLQEPYNDVPVDELSAPTLTLTPSPKIPSATPRRKSSLYNMASFEPISFRTNVLQRTPSIPKETVKETERETREESNDNERTLLDERLDKAKPPNTTTTTPAKKLNSIVGTVSRLRPEEVVVRKRNTFNSITDHNVTLDSSIKETKLRISNTLRNSIRLTEPEEAKSTTNRTPEKRIGGRMSARAYHTTAAKEYSFLTSGELRESKGEGRSRTSTTCR